MGPNRPRPEGASPCDPRPVSTVSRRALAVGLAGCALAAMTGCSTRSNQPADRQRLAPDAAGGIVSLAADKRPVAPVLVGSTLEGASYTTGSLAGKVVVVNFWASWCDPCKAEAATLEQVYQDTRSKGVQFVGVDFRNDQKAQAKLFVQGRGITYPNLFDPDSRLSLAFQAKKISVAAVPTTVLVDRQGRIAGAVYGGPVRFTDLERMVDQLAAEPKA